MRALLVCALMAISMGCATKITVTPTPVQTDVRPILTGTSCIRTFMGWVIKGEASYDEAVKNGRRIDPSMRWREIKALPTQQIHAVRSVSITGGFAGTCVEVVGE